MNPYPGKNELQLIALFNVIAEVLNITITPKGAAHELFMELNRKIEINSLGSGCYSHNYRGRTSAIRVSFGTYDPAPILYIEISKKGSRTIASLTFHPDGNATIQDFRETKWLKDCKDEEVKRIQSVVGKLSRSRQGWKIPEFQSPNTQRFCSA